MESIQVTFIQVQAGEKERAQTLVFDLMFLSWSSCSFPILAQVWGRGQPSLLLRLLDVGAWEALAAIHPSKENLRTSEHGYPLVAIHQP